MNHLLQPASICVETIKFSGTYLFHEFGMRINAKSTKTIVTGKLVIIEMIDLQLEVKAPV